jgi:hypothetical protein
MRSIEMIETEVSSSTNVEFRVPCRYSGGVDTLYVNIYQDYNDPTDGSATFTIHSDQPLIPSRTITVSLEDAAELGRKLNGFINPVPDDENEEDEE